MQAKKRKKKWEETHETILSTETADKANECLIIIITTR